MPTNPPDHLNNIERALIDKLRTGTYTTTTGSATAWSSGDVEVYGQYPTTDDVHYPSIITEMVANGMEQQFMGQKLTNNAGTDARGELYGVGFNIHIMVDSESSITVTNTTSGGDVAQPYRERRLLNYLMLNCANVLMDLDFSNITKGATGTPAATEVDQRMFSGFRDLAYNPELDLWMATASMVVVFKNSR
ncbi:MAG: hypothetical protein CM15mV52_0870 [uncultured marine virus]|nr:MAG: hypothetical protein CM15mV52_0870 [uncultured marine virus]